jgi:putative two-component system hydrogenase maturation factor HypX/HoxX
MRILFLSHSFNSLTQRLYVELTERGHDVSIEFDINDMVTVEAVRRYQPDLIVAPFLKRAIPEEVWRHHVCLIVHPGVPGDRGPSALDWAIANGGAEWGVSVLQANGELDAGPIWASANFTMRAARKSSLYRNEVAGAAVAALLQAIERFGSGGYAPAPQDYGRSEIRGRPHPLMAQADRRVNWSADDTETIVRKIHAADGYPGVEDELFGEPCCLYDAWAEDTLRGTPGEVIARRHGAVCRGTVDGAVWIGHLRKIISGERTFKLPAALVLGERLRHVPESLLPLEVPPARGTYKDIWYEEKNGAGYLHFDFYNGAMSTEQCQRVLEAYLRIRQRPTRVIVLMGGADFWSNGLHLNCIEAADSPADESWRNINAMDDLAEAILRTDTHLTIAALQGNAGAGGVFLALAADRVYARAGVVLNPHYKGMGNLYGSEYWTYLLPKRVGAARAQQITESRLPIGAAAARRLGLVDDCFGDDIADFRRGVAEIAEALAADTAYAAQLARKRQQRERDEMAKPLADYRTEELERMKLNFYGFDPSYHVARYNFVFRIQRSWTPRYLARHRRLDWNVAIGGSQESRPA